MCWNVTIAWKLLGAIQRAEFTSDVGMQLGIQRLQFFQQVLQIGLESVALISGPPKVTRVSVSCGIKTSVYNLQNLGRIVWLHLLYSVVMNRVSANKK